MIEHACLRLGLAYYPDSKPGFRRHRRGKGFAYTSPDGTRVTCAETRARLAALAVPPAYTDVWMAPRGDAHLLATGRDAVNRKQYRYHPEWEAYRSREKFTRLPALYAGLPRLRAWIARHLARDDEDLDAAVAAALALMDRMSLRVGNARYSAENGSFAATTLRMTHLVEAEGRLVLNYPAKGGDWVEKPVRGQSLVISLRRMAEDRARGRLITWKDGRGRRQGLSGAVVAQRLQDLVRSDVTPKDLRTWNGSHAAFVAAARMDDPGVKDIAQAAARRLHNTPAIARKSYIHPAVVDAVKDGCVIEISRHRPPTHLRRGEPDLAAFIGAKVPQGGT